MLILYPRAIYKHYITNDIPYIKKVRLVQPLALTIANSSAGWQDLYLAGIHTNDMSKEAPKELIDMLDLLAQVWDQAYYNNIGIEPDPTNASKRVAQEGAKLLQELF